MSRPKFSFSSREETGIGRALKQHAVTVRVDKHNFEDIELFVRAQSDSLLLELDDCGASKEELSEIRNALESVANKSEGIIFSVAGGYPWFMADWILLQACFFTQNSFYMSSKTTEHCRRFKSRLEIFRMV